jgi:DivIVA domain-containing protein
MLVMDVSPKTLREVEFRVKTRGYHPEDVDQFLEQVAAGVEVLQDRMRQAVERAQRAEAAAAEAGDSDETLRKTLVLAQRTADLAVQEAREQATRILAGAEQQAQAIIAEADERGRRTHEDAIAECRAELSRLESARAQAQQDVDTLNRWLEEHKAHLHDALSDAIMAVDRAGLLWPPPTTRPSDVPGVPGPARSGPTALPLPASEPAGAGPPTERWSPSDSDRLEALSSESDASTSTPSSPPDVPDVVPQGQGNERANGPNDQALDDFFDDNGDLSDDRRFGSRLRRRR